MPDLPDFISPNFPSLAGYLSPRLPAPPPPPADIPATGTGDWFTSGVMAGVHGALSEGARALQAGAQLAGATDTAQSLSDFAEEHHAREQSYAREDLEAHPWSPAGIGYNIARMVPMGLAALGGGAVATAAAPEVAGAGLLGAAGTMFLPAAGANVQRQISETGELTTPGKALALGVPEAFVQGFLPGRLESFFGRGILRGITHSAAMQGFAGGTTEWLTQKMGDPNREFADRASAIGSQALSGAALGGILGGAFGGLRALAGKPASQVLNDPKAQADAVDQALAPKQVYPYPQGPELQRLPAPETPPAGPIVGGPPPQDMSPGELLARLGVLHPLLTQEGNTPADHNFASLYEELQRRTAAIEPASPEGQKLIGYVQRMSAPLQDLSNLELSAKLDTLKPLVTGDPQNPADQAFEPLRQEYLRRAAEQPAAPAAPTAEVPLAAHEPAAPAAPAPVVPEPVPPAAHEPAAPVVPPVLAEPSPAVAPVPVIDFTKGRIKEGTAQYAAASPEAQAAMRQPLIDAIIARGDKAPTALQKRWGEALDILTPKGELREEFIPERPPEAPPGVAAEAAPAAPVDPLAIPDFLRRAPPVARDTPVETADDRAAVLNGVKAQIAKLPDSEIRDQHIVEAETVERLLPNAENNPGLVGRLNARISGLRAAVDAAAQPPADQVAPPDLAPSPHAEARPAPSGDLDVRLTGAQAALVGLRKALGDRPDAVAALDQHEAWLKTVRDAAGPEDLRKALAANPEADPDADNLSNLTQLSKSMSKQISSYLARQQAVLQEMQYQSGSRARVVTSRDGLPVTQLDADVTDMHQRGVPLADVADHIIEHTADPEQAEIVAKLKPFLPKDAKTVFRDGVVDKEGEYFPKDKTSALYNAADATVTAIHEMAHAVMHRALDGDSAAAETVRSIYDQLKGKGDHAGLTDAHEMVSEAFANPVYRDFLRSQFVRGTSLWDRFVDAARGVIGLEPRLFNAFDRIMSLGDDLMKEQQQYPNDAWVGPNSYARRGDDGAGAAAAGADQVRETIYRGAWENAKLAINKFGRDLGFGMADSYRLGRVYGNDVKSMPLYAEAMKKVDTREKALFRASLVGERLMHALPGDERKQVYQVAEDAGFYGLDPKQPAPLDIQDIPGRVALYQELAANWNQLSPAAKAAYEAVRAKGSADFHANLLDKLQQFEKTLPEYSAPPNGFDTFGQQQRIHPDPIRTEAFFKQAVADRVDGLTKYRDTLADQQTKADKAIKAGNAAIKAGGEPVDDLKELGKQRDSLKSDVGSINSTLKDVASLRETAAKAPYFHQGRDGDYFGTAKFLTDADGNVDKEKLAQFIEFLDDEGHKGIAVKEGGEHDTLYVRVKSLSELRELHNSLLRAQKAGLLSPEKDSIGAGDATQVFNSIAPEAMRKAVAAMSRPDVPEGVDVDKFNKAFDANRADMQRTLLNMMAENSIGRILTRRANVQGFSKDVLNSSLYASQVMSRSLAHMTMAPEIGALIGNMSDELRVLNHDQTVDLNTRLAATQAVGELTLRDRLRTTYVPQGGLDTIRHVSHTIHVGSNPMYFLTLMSQLATTTLPELGKTHGYGAATQAMFKNTPQAFEAIKAIAQSEDWATTGITQAALENNPKLTQTTISRIMGALKRGSIGDLYSTQMAQHSSLESILGKVGISPTIVKASNAMGLYAELYPRVLSLLAAHDLYDTTPYIDPMSRTSSNPKGTVMPVEQFVDRAVDESQGVWGASLTPRQLTKGGTLGAAAPFVNQFMGWSARWTGKMYNEVRDLFDERTRPEATRWLLGHGAAVTMLAGTLGLPLLSVASSVYDRLMDWVTNRDDHDLTASYRSFLSDTFGKDMGEIIARGLPRAAGMDFAHFGEATIVPGSSTINFAFEKRKLEDAERDWFKSMGGAGAGDIFNALAAVRDVSNGDYLNGLIKMAPEIIKAPAEAYRLSERGFVNNLTGQKLPMTASASDIAMTMLGIDPAKQAEYQEVTREAAGLRTMRELSSSNIVRHMEQAYMRNDPAMLNTWMGEAQKWQVDHPGLVPPQVSFGRELENHMRASAEAKGMGLPVGVTPRDVGARGALRYGNIGTQ